MDPSISVAATGKVPTKMAASATSEPKRSLKRSNAQIDSSQTLEEPEQETPYSGNKRGTKERIGLFFEGLNFDNISFPFGDLDDLRLRMEQICADLEQRDHIYTPRGMKLIKDLDFSDILDAITWESSKIFSLSITCIIEREAARKTIADLKAEVTLNCNELALAKARLSESESSHACLVSRVKSLEAELKSKDAEILALKKQATASEQKVSSNKEKSASLVRLLKSSVKSLEAKLESKDVENQALKKQATALEQKASSTKEKALSLVRKIVRLDKFSKELSTAANNAIEELKGFEEFQDHAAELLLFLSSSHQDGAP